VRSRHRPRGRRTSAPIPCWTSLDETGEVRADQLQRGNSGANPSLEHLDSPGSAPGRLTCVQPGPQGQMLGLGLRGLAISLGFEATEPVRAEILVLPTSSWLDSITKERRN